ncbi:MAG: hypothetical protein Q4C61_00795 [Lachnospiraceae bacterium]|nr:hypothetical protein [Lachnospiraceae bacterium]
MKLFDVFRKNNLDEMQEQKLLHIEKNGFWILYFLLAVEMVIKCVLGAPKNSLLGEFICFMAVSVYMLFMCVKNGIWDRHLKGDAKTNLLLGLLAGGIVTALNVLVYVIRAERTVGWLPILLLSAAAGFLTFFITFSLTSILVFFCKRTEERLEKEPEEDEEI